MGSPDHHEAPPGTSRRAIVKGAAWSVPVVAAAVATPAVAASATVADVPYTLTVKPTGQTKGQCTVTLPVGASAISYKMSGGGGGRGNGTVSFANGGNAAYLAGRLTSGVDKILTPTTLTVIAGAAGYGISADTTTQRTSTPGGQGYGNGGASLAETGPDLHYPYGYGGGGGGGSAIVFGNVPLVVAGGGGGGGGLSGHYDNGNNTLGISGGGFDSGNGGGAKTYGAIAVGTPVAGDSGSSVLSKYNTNGGVELVRFDALGGGGGGVSPGVAGGNGSATPTTFLSEALFAPGAAGTGTGGSSGGNGGAGKAVQRTDTQGNVQGTSTRYKVYASSGGGGGGYTGGGSGGTCNVAKNGTPGLWSTAGGAGGGGSSYLGAATGTITPSVTNSTIATGAKGGTTSSLAEGGYVTITFWAKPGLTIGGSCAVTSG